MKSPRRNAIAIRALGQLLGQVHPAAPKLMSDAATQLEILDELHSILQERCGEDKANGILEHAMARVNARRAADASEGEPIELIAKNGDEVTGHQKDEPFNPSRN